ncbi:group I truncated hemoglobin [Mastigocoleus testarum]|uniref:Group 1 truncated hemoglobin n=1 Tax=Mastigocoleus testarum BC008 TaxID=371196 RepID=A0A0V7ZVU6_9CYAN|nr:group 1 truncated hemoglobin [Mastigocoleus testarum]KST68571.1 globin [Mastigocoleus testarum BC008]
MTVRTSTLFERLGGETAVKAVVDKFYLRVMEDSRINHFFAGVNMEKQREHQAAFLKFTFGGSSYYQGLSLRKAHQNLVKEFGLSDEHFDAVFEHLVSTLKDLNVANDLIQEVGDNLESIRSYVLDK